MESRLLRCHQQGHAGEVFLPKGEYAICKTLKVPYGIVLRGELADYRLNSSNIQLPIGDYPLGGDTTPDDLSSYYKLGTVIRPLNTNYPLTVDRDTYHLVRQQFCGCHQP